MGPGVLFPTNPDLADVLGRTDLNFDNFDFFELFDPTFLDFQVPRFPKFGLGWAGPLTRRLRMGGSQELFQFCCPSVNLFWGRRALEKVPDTYGFVQVRL